jgi:F-type H+-transporting ATPase subunit a
MHPISVSAEKLFTLFGVLPVTNSLLATWCVMLFLTVVAFLTTRKMQVVPKGLHNMFEAAFEEFLKLFESVLEDKGLARKIFYFITTLFIFILCTNWFGLIPGVGSIGFFGKENAVTEESVETISTGQVAGTHETGESAESTTLQETEESLGTEEGVKHESEFVPLFRAASSDLSFTIALALIAVLYIQFMGLSTLRVGYFKKFLNFKGPIHFFVGLLEIVSEFAKMISFSFRLYGNIFAGEVLLTVIIFLVPYVAPMPFYGMEIFVGMVQALVFTMLTLVFIKIATTHH